MQVMAPSKMLSHFYSSLISKLQVVKTPLLITTAIMIDLLLSFIFSVIFFPNHQNGPSFSSKLEAFFIAIIVAPFFETLIFQHGIIKLVLNKKPNALLFACLLSASLFAISHYYSFAYILKAFSLDFYLAHYTSYL